MTKDELEGWIEDCRPYKGKPPSLDGAPRMVIGG